MNLLLEEILPCIFLFTVTSCGGNVFTVQPGRGSVQALIGVQVQLNCSVSPQYVVDWELHLPGDKGPVNTLNLSAVSIEQLEDRGIMVQNVSMVDSQLIINGMEENNRTTVQCVAVNTSEPTVTISAQERVQVYFYDLTIANLAATEVGLGSLRLMWWFPIPTLFTLTVINLNDSTSIPYIVSGIPDQHYVFVRENAPPTSCDVYRFQVAASDNPNIQSDVVTRSVPSLPDISPLETSLQHSLEPAQNRFTLNVAFNKLTTCSEYPVHNYTLVVEDSGGNRTAQNSQATGDTVNIAISGLRENSRYSYHVLATNEFGTSPPSTPVTIATTDVSNVTICQINSTTFSIQCSYLNGSDASGCVYVLVSGEEGVESVRGTIDRSNSAGEAIQLSSILDFDIVLAFDLEEGNTISTVPISVTIRAATSTSVCPTAAAPPPPLSREAAAGTIVVITVCATVFLTVLWIAYLIKYDRECLVNNCLCRKIRWVAKSNRYTFKPERRDRKKTKKETSDQTDDHIPDISDVEFNVVETTSEPPQSYFNMY